MFTIFTNNVSRIIKVTHRLMPENTGYTYFKDGFPSQKLLTTKEQRLFKQKLFGWSSQLLI